MGDARVAVALCLITACGGAASDLPDPPAGLEVAWTVDGCAPWDGPATTIYLAATAPADTTPIVVPYPHLWISLYYPRSELPGRTLEWSTGEINVGDAMKCEEEGVCEVPREARVRVRRISGDTTLSGEIWLMFPDSSVIEGGFRAAVLEQPRYLCG